MIRLLAPSLIHRRSSSPPLALFHPLSLVAQLRRSHSRFSRRGLIYPTLPALICPSDHRSHAPPPNLPSSPLPPLRDIPTSRVISPPLSPVSSLCVCVCVCVLESAFPYFLQGYFCNCLPGNIVQFSLPNSSPLSVLLDLCLQLADYHRILQLRWYLSVSYC